jgi:outer membrane protein assembly factor BamB
MRFRAFSLLLLTAAVASAENWPQWRGPSSNGISSEKGLPAEWSETSNVAWKTKLPGQGRSSPVVWGDRIFLTADIEGDKVEGIKAPIHHLRGKEFLHPDSIGVDKKHTLIVLCLDRETGKILWRQTAYEGAVYDNRHKSGSYATPTAIVEDKTVYAYFGTEGLYAYDFNGKLLWKYMPGKIQTIGLGPGSSPAHEGELIFLQCDSSDGKSSFITAINKKTGKQVWRVDRATNFTWASPVIVESGGRKELITSATESVIAYDPKTGKELWRGPGVKGNAVPTPVSGQGLIVFTAGYPERYAYAVKAGSSGELKADHQSILWQKTKGTAYVPSPIFYGDYVYLITDKGLLTCIEARTGKLLYEGGRVPVPGTFTASPIAYDGKILLFSQEGDTFVIKAGPVHEVLRTNSVSEPIYVSPAVSNGTLFLRTGESLYAIRQ